MVKNNSKNCPSVVGNDGISGWRCNWTWYHVVDDQV